MVSLTHDTMNYRPGPCPGAQQPAAAVVITSYTPGLWQ